MYLHLGNSVVIRKADLVGVFDLDNASQSPRTRQFLAAAERSGSVINAAGDEIPKSFIVCADEKAGQRVYLSQLNTSTLLRRSAGRGLDASFE